MASSWASIVNNETIRKKNVEIEAEIMKTLWLSWSQQLLEKFSSFEEWIYSGHFSRNRSGFITQIFLFDLGLKTIPAEIGKLSYLQELYFQDNQITTIPLEIGNLISLRWIILRNNQLTSIPPEICNLSSLKHLDLANNRLISLPSEIDNLNRATVYFGNNFLVDRPTFGHIGDQKLPDQLPPQYPKVDFTETIPDNFFLLLKENQFISIDAELLSSRWKYIEIVLTSGSFEVQTRQLDLSNFFSSRVAQCLVELFYGMTIQVDRLDHQDCVDLVEHAEQFYLTSRECDLLIKYCKIRIG